MAIKLKNSKKGNYTNLKRELFFRLLLITVAATVTVFLLRSILRGQIADRIVEFLINAFHFGDRDALTIYQLVIRNNMDMVVFAVILIFLVILFRFYVSWFTKYFDEISAGMDHLVEESEEDISLSPAMDFMENRLNTLKKRLEKRTKDAQEAERRKNDLVVYLAHDIKTPLTSVIGYLSLLDEAPDMPPEQKAKYVGITLEKAYALEQLIDEFFEITRFNLQSIVLSKGKINLSFMLQQISDEFYPMLTPQGKKTLVDAPAGLFLCGDADKLSRVFNNILKNAMAYSYRDSTIYIKAERKTENMIITFTNDGDPIPAEKLETIFEKFFRLDASRSSQTGGAGLGLAIAKEIVAAHGGTITAQSDKTKTIFTVTLPIGDV
ncbi:sensor histidine kinase [Aggregatilinea lenta]|uniref:sensor histidine kinase n=1 Tax=Aggregatilinea lenta TaxID=913108 RepID=UPI001EE7C632|nr:HAMP domain-containing sensor histidine kinase [Aggregatilinea lenta]